MFYITVLIISFILCFLLDKDIEDLKKREKDFIKELKKILAFKK